jgi:hypothetical protein
MGTGAMNYPNIESWDMGGEEFEYEPKESHEPVDFFLQLPDTNEPPNPYRQGV